MQFLGWMFDIAREQSPSRAAFTELAQRTAAAGYTALGLYLEHRFAYPSAPWAAGPGAVTPADVAALRASAPPGLRIVPFLNTLGHMEGFLRAEGGQWYAEGRGDGLLGLQMCPSRPECAALARGLVEDALAAFDDEWLHLGGDETRQLGECPHCAPRVATLGKGGLYAAHFAPLCEMVLRRGRRPAIWADMVLHHPEALDRIPRQTVLFDWQYDHGPAESTALLRNRGFDVVCCPAVHSYDAGWCFLELTQRNIDAHAADARRHGALGVLVTSWECCFFSQYAGLMPIILAAGRRLAAGGEWDDLLEEFGGPGYAAAADILGRRLPEADPFLSPGTWRQLRDRFVIRQNPFYLWQDWRTAVTGPAGAQILRWCDAAEAAIGGAAGLLAFPIALHRAAVRFVQAVERGYQRYHRSDHAGTVDELRSAAGELERLRPLVVQAAQSGGSAADVARLDLLVGKIARAIERVEAVPRTGFRPGFETLVHDGYVPGDQAGWRTGAYR